MAEKSYTWIEVEMNKEGNCASIRGLIESDLLESIIDRTYKEYFFRMDKVHWIRIEEDDENSTKTMHFHLYGGSGPLYAMKGYTFLRTEDIREISPLQDEYEEIYDMAKFQESIDY